MRGFTARNTPYMGLVDRRPVVCRNLAIGFWVPLQEYIRKHKTKIHVSDLAALTRAIAARGA